MTEIINRFLDWLLLPENTKELIKINEIATLLMEAIKQQNIEAIEILKEILQEMECKYHEKDRLFWREQCDIYLSILKYKNIEDETK